MPWMSLTTRQRPEAQTLWCTYVLGPGHHWPLVLLPLYKLFELLPATRATANRLGLLGIDTVLRCLLHAIENPPRGLQSWDVPTMRRVASAER